MAHRTPTPYAADLPPDDESALRGVGRRMAQWADDLPFVPLRPYEYRGLQIGWRSIVLVALVALAFAFGVGRDGLWQDERLLADPAVRTGRALAAAWGSPLHGETAPMTRTLAWVETRWLGAGPVGFRVVSLMLHATTCLFGWFVLRRLAVPAAWLAAATVAVHPALLTNVAWPLRQGDLLAAAAAMVAVWAYLVARRVQPAIGERVWTDPAYHGDDDYFPWWPWALFGLGMTVALLCGSAVPVLAAGGLIALEAQFRQLTRGGAAALGGLLVLAIVARAVLPHAALPAQELRPQPAASMAAEAAAAVPYSALHAALPTVAAPVVTATWAGLSTDTLRTLDAALPAMPPLGQDREPWGRATVLLPAAGLTIALVAAAAVAWRRTWGLLAVAVAGYAVAHGLTAGWPRGTAVAGADLTPYGAVACMVVLGVAVVAGRLRQRTGDAVNRAVRWAGGAVVLIGLVTTTALRGPAFALPDAAWQQAVANDPGDRTAREELAARYQTEGFLDEAGVQLDKVAEPRRDTVWLLARGRLFNDQKRYAEAARCFEIAHQQRPEDNFTTTMFAESLNVIGRPDIAAGLYDQLVARSPTDKDVLTNAGLTRMRIGRRDEAIALYRRALGIDADHIPALVNLANALFDTGHIDRMEEAASHLHRVVALDPRNVVAFLNSGVMLLHLGDYASAERMLRGAVHLQQSPDAYRKLGAALAAQDKLAEAIWSFGQAANLDPYDPATNAELAKLRQASQKRPATKTR